MLQDILQYMTLRYPVLILVVINSKSGDQPFQYLLSTIQIFIH